MTRLLHRRALLSLLIAAGLSLGQNVRASEADEVRGTLTYAGGAAIPEGIVRIVLDGTAAEDAGTAQKALRIESDGKSTALDFSMKLPQPVSGKPRLVAHLEREDGWLLARGMATIEQGTPVTLTLFKTMY